MTTFVTGRMRWDQAQYLKSMPKEQRRAFWKESLGTWVLGSLNSVTSYVLEDGSNPIRERALAMAAAFEAHYAAVKTQGRRRARGRLRDEIWPPLLSADTRDWVDRTSTSVTQQFCADITEAEKRRDAAIAEAQRRHKEAIAEIRQVHKATCREARRQRDQMYQEVDRLVRKADREARRKLAAKQP